MGEVIAVISGKGGTGKTTVCAAVASCLAAEGKKVLCIDADIGLRNLDIALGMADEPIIAFTDVLHGHYDINDASEHPHLSGLYLFTAPVRENGDLISSVDFGLMLEKVRLEYDYCLIDAPAGIGTGFRLATDHADRCIVVSTADPASLRDAGCAADLLILDGKEELYLVVNRVIPKLFSRMDLTVDDIMDGVGLPLLGIVPEEIVTGSAEEGGREVGGNGGQNLKPGIGGTDLLDTVTLLIIVLRYTLNVNVDNQITVGHLQDLGVLSSLTLGSVDSGLAKHRLGFGIIYDNIKLCFNVHVGGGSLVCNDDLLVAELQNRGECEIGILAAVSQNLLNHIRGNVLSELGVY